MAQNTDNTELPKILRNYFMIRVGFMGSSAIHGMMCSRMC